MRYLIQTVETFRADTEAEAQGIITEAKQAGEYGLTKYASEKNLTVKCYQSNHEGDLVDNI